MSDQITKKQLQYLVRRINKLTDSPFHAWVRQPDGTLQAQIGNYHLSSAYSGVCLHRMMNESGGITTPLGAGYFLKRELYTAMRAFIAGLEQRSRVS